MERIIEINNIEDIPSQFRGTPIGLFLEYNNLDRTPDVYTNAQMLVGMCMDNRKHLKIPENFTYIIRSGGANMRHSEFKISYAIAVGGIKYIALLGHNNCGMVNLYQRKQQFVNGLIETAGIDPQTAEDHFMQFAPMFEIGNEIDFVISEAARLRQKYPKIVVVPMMYNVESNKISIVIEE